MASKYINFAAAASSQSDLSIFLKVDYTEPSIHTPISTTGYAGKIS